MPDTTTLTLSPAGGEVSTTWTRRNAGATKLSVIATITSGTISAYSMDHTNTTDLDNVVGVKEDETLASQSADGGWNIDFPAEAYRFRATGTGGITFEVKEL